MDGEFGVRRCKLLDFEWISNEVLLYSTANFSWSLGADHVGRYHEKRERMFTYDWVAWLNSKNGHNTVNQKEREREKRKEKRESYERKERERKRKEGRIDEILYLNSSVLPKCPTQNEPTFYFMVTHT